MLAWGDGEVCEDGSGLFAVRRSKTDSEAEGRVRYLHRAAMEALDGVRSEDGNSETSVLLGCRAGRS